MEEVKPGCTGRGYGLSHTLQIQGELLIGRWAIVQREDALTEVMVEFTSNSMFRAVKVMPVLPRSQRRPASPNRRSASFARRSSYPRFRWQFQRNLLR